MNTHLLLKNRIKEFRLKSGLTQKELAFFCGCSKNTISSLETSQFSPSAYLGFLLCKVLNCKFEELFYLPKGVGSVLDDYRPLEDYNYSFGSCFSQDSFDDDDLVEF